MIAPGTIICPRCDEDRPSLIHTITDPLGQRYYCCCCGHEFKSGKVLYAAGVSGKQ